MSDDPLAMVYPRARLVVSSRAAHLPGPIDGPTLSDDESILSLESKTTTAIGMTGKLCMHAGQAATVNRELAPSPAELDWARDVIAQFGEDGSNVRDGSDLPRCHGPRRSWLRPSCSQLAPSPPTVSDHSLRRLRLDLRRHGPDDESSEGSGTDYPEWDGGIVIGNEMTRETWARDTVRWWR